MLLRKHTKTHTAGFFHGFILPCKRASGLLFSLLPILADLLEHRNLLSHSSRNPSSVRFLMPKYVTMLQVFFYVIADFISGVLLSGAKRVVKPVLFEC